MLVQGGFRNVKDSVTANEFLKLLAEQAPNGHYFVAQPPPGILMTAAIDWRVIVPDRSSIDTLATALWSGYETMVKPLQPESTGRSPVIFIQMKNYKGECDQFIIGKDVEKKDCLVHRMKESAAVLSPKDRELALQRELAATMESEYWLKLC